MRIPSIFFVLIVLCLPAARGMAQNRAPLEIQGYLFDEENDDPWIGVTVTVQGYGVGAITDEHGKFVLTLPQRPTTDSIGLQVRGLEVGDQKLMVQCPAEGDRLEAQFKVMNYLSFIQNKKAVDGDGKRGGYGGHGGHGEDFGPGHGDGKFGYRLQRPGEYYVDREGIVWKMAY